MRLTRKTLCSFRVMSGGEQFIGPTGGESMSHEKPPNEGSIWSYAPSTVQLPRFVNGFLRICYGDFRPGKTESLYKA